VTSAHTGWLQNAPSGPGQRSAQAAAGGWRKGVARALRHEVARVERASWEGSADVEGIAPKQCSSFVFSLTCVADNGGVRSSGGQAQGRPLHPGATAKRKTGRANASEPPMMPRHFQPHGWVAMLGSRTGRWEAADADWLRPASRENTVVSGYRGRPTRSYLTRAERGNPVGVQAPVVSGKPTVRKAQLLRRERMPNKRMPVRRKTTGNRDHTAGSSAGRFG
jgi:hypothetical protein